MPSKVKSKKSKRSVSTACWAQNDDGTFSLTIGSKKLNTSSETSEMLSSTELDITSQVSVDYNGNITKESTLKSPQLNQTVPLIATTIPSIINTPIKILKSNWSQNGISYRERQQMKRRDEMTAEYVSNRLVFG